MFGFVNIINNREDKTTSILTKIEENLNNLPPICSSFSIILVMLFIRKSIDVPVNAWMLPVVMNEEMQTIADIVIRICFKNVFVSKY